MASEQLAPNITMMVEPKTKRKYKNNKDTNATFKELATLGKAMSCVKRRLNVATPLWDKCEDETHTPKSGKLESFGTPEDSELEFKSQNTLH